VGLFMNKFFDQTSKYNGVYLSEVIHYYSL